MPYNLSAVEWSDQHFDHTYAARWWPKSLPTLVVSGVADQIVDQSLWNDPRFQGQHVWRRWIDNAAHFPWIENQVAIRKVFSELAAHIQEDV